MNTQDLLVTDRVAVRKYYGKTDKDVFADIDNIRKWAKSQPHCPEVPGDEVIEFMLVTVKFSVEKTKQNLDMYYTIRGLIPDFYENKHPRLAHMQIPHSTGMFCPLPKLTDDLSRVAIVKAGVDVDNFDLRICFAQILNVAEIRLQEDLSVDNIFIFDGENLKIGHAAKLSPMVLSKCRTVFEKVFGSRVSAIHLINSPPFIDTVISIAKMFLKPKLASRIFTHTTMDSLYKEVPKKLLPRDYGGEELSLSELSELWTKKLVEYHERFDKLDNMRVNEKLRPESLENNEILGYHGNFKKLEVD